MRKSSLTERFSARDTALSDIGACAPARSSSTARPFSSAGARYFGSEPSVTLLGGRLTLALASLHPPGLTVGEAIACEALGAHFGGESRRGGWHVSPCTNAYGRH